MNRIPRPLARRLDRLAYRAHAFHRYAHHPLCPAYAEEVIRFGRRAAVCRGCTFALAGTVTGLAAALTWPTPFTPSGALLFALLPALLALFALAAGARPHRLRLGKRFTRTAPLATATAFATFGLRTGDATGAAASATTMAIMLAAWATYRLRGPNRRPCLVCPERHGPHTCRGFRVIVRRQAAVGRMTGRLLRHLRPLPEK